VAPIAIRAAFSNIHTWTVLKGDLQLASQVGSFVCLLAWQPFLPARLLAPLLCLTSSG
jgi:hypothetical protein